VPAGVEGEPNSFAKAKVSRFANAATLVGRTMAATCFSVDAADAPVADA
jgi:hypothetical protein